MITTGERSLRWEYLPGSQYYLPTNTKNAKPLSMSPLRGSTGMVGMPMSALQSTLGSQPFSRRSVTDKKIKLSPALMASNGQSASKRLVAIVSPQRRPQTEKKAAGTVTSVSSPADKTVAELRNQPSNKKKDPTPSKKEYSKSAMKTAVSDIGVKMPGKRSWQTLVTSRKAPLVNAKAWKSVGGSSVSRVSRIPSRLKSVPKLSSARTPQKSRKSCGNFQVKNTVLSMKKTKSEQKVTFTVSDQEKKRKLESGLRSAERAAKKLKLESPKTPDKKKMAALLVCHGKVSRPKTPQFVSSFPQPVEDTLKVERKSGIHTTAAKSGSAVRKAARKTSENLQSEIPTDFNFGSNTLDLDVSFGEKIKESPLRSSQKSRRSRILKLEQAVSPKLEETVNISGVAELFSSPVNVSSKQKIASITCDNGHTPAAERELSGISASHLTPDSSRSEIGFSSGKKTPKHSVHHSPFGKRLKKTQRSKSASDSEDVKDAETHQSNLGTPHAGRRSRCISLSTPETNDLTNKTLSARKSGILSVKQTPNYGSHCSGTTKSPEMGEKARSVTSSTPSPKQTTSGWNSRSSLIAMQSPKSVESTSISPPETGDKGVSVSQGTPASKLTASVRKSRSSVGIHSPESYESDSRSSPRTGDKGKSGFTSSPASERAAAAGKLRGSRVVMQSPEVGGTGNSSTRKKRNANSAILFPKATDQNCTSVRTFLRSPAGQDHEEVIPVSDLSMLKQSSPNAVALVLDEGHGSSGSGVSKSSEKHMHRLPRSDSTLNAVTTQNCVLLQESGFSYDYKSSSPKKRVSESYENQTLPTPDSVNTTFDFDSVKTPHISVEKFVSPLSSSRKRKSSTLQVVRNGQHFQKLMEMSPKNSLGRVQEFSNNSRILKSCKNDFSDVSGVQQLPETQSSPKSPTNDTSDVHRRIELTKASGSPKSTNYLTDMFIAKHLSKVPRHPKTPKNDLKDVSGVKQLMKTPKSPKNDLSDVRGVRQLMKTPRSPKYPINDLSDVRGVKQLMKTPKSQKSPKNDLSDVRGVKQLMKIPKSQKSPKNDLSDVHGVKELMETPRSVTSATDYLTDIDVHELGKAVTLGGDSSWTESKPKFDSSAVSGEVSSVATRTRRKQASGMATPIKHSPEFIKTDINEAGKSGTEMNAVQKNVHSPEEVKTSNARSKRKRNEPHSTLKAEVADGTPKPLSKKQGQKEKVEDVEDPSPGRHVDILAGSSDKSLASGRSQNRVQSSVPSSPTTPVARVTRRKRGVATAEVKLPASPPETIKTLRSRRNVAKTESATAFEKAKEDTSDVQVSSPPARRTRGKKLTSAVEISSLKKKSCNADTVEVESPFPSKMQLGANVNTDKEEFFPARSKRKLYGSVNTGSELSSPLKVNESTSVIVDTIPSPPRRLRGAIVTTKVEIPQSPVTRKTRGKLTVTPAVTSSPDVSTVPVENQLFSTTSKQPPANSSPLSAVERGKQETKPFKSPSPRPTRKLRGTKLSEEEETESSVTETRKKKTRVISSPLSKAKSPTPPRRGGSQSTKKEVSPLATTERQIRACRRKK
ncbi:mucin-17-like isoform X3 [Zootermopsis nevadensis]|nr:mucin-17-like isoform X3 [Zootermopsis nevadensis]